MSDLLVKLYALPPLAPAIALQSAQGIRIMRAMPPNKRQIVAWVLEHFGDYWASETDVAIGRTPSSCYIAVEGNTIVGFACHDATCKNFFGPTGVHPDYRKRSIGTALLLACLHAMHDQGYAYAIIGDASSNEYYEKTVGATVIEGSKPGIFRDLLPNE
jgi:GNAT superfamily N-acetyltransferase